jgi:predicted trehalose synthase
MKTDIDLDRQITRLAIYTDRNSERPLDAAELLHVAANAINDLYQQSSHANRQSFRVQSVLVDINLGQVSVYLYYPSSCVT